MGKETLLSYFNISKPTFIFIDAHQSGLSAILALGSDKDNAKPVALASRCTSKAEKNYAQLDLEAMAADFALRRFRLYLVGAPNNTIIVTDHHPLLSVFNGKKNGSIRTDCIKLMTPGFSLQYKKLHNLQIIQVDMVFLGRHLQKMKKMNPLTWPTFFIYCLSPQFLKLLELKK